VNKDEVCDLIEEVGIIPAIRVSSSDDAHFAVEAVTRGGIPIVEITMTSPEAVQMISHLVKFHPEVLVGAGTVLNIETAQRCVDAGAGFITAPGFNSQIVDFVVKQNVAVLAGALTPTEVVAASEAGSHFVKVFPCAPVGGDVYIKALNTALPHIPLIAAGGVNQQTARGFILAGATAIGVGKDLIPPEAIERRQADRIRELAHRFIGFVREARHLLTARKQSVMTHKAVEECEKEAVTGRGRGKRR
jgi:2-dehydro-3-deoxyphosphogluconate aldolase / (4S)-4-hydroxy-2-oxoglutarate aldolase